MDVIACPLENHTDSIRKVESIVLEGRSLPTTVQVDGSSVRVEGTVTQFVAMLAAPQKPAQKGAVLGCIWRESGPLRFSRA